MARFPCRALLGLLLVLAPDSAVAQSWRKPLDRFLDSPPLNRHLWGIAVADSTGRLLYQRNGNRMFIPASNAKLVVAAAAAVLLPPDWKVETRLYGTGPVHEGMLAGHLVLYGGGDPTMSRRCYQRDTLATGACVADPFSGLRALVDQLKARGIRTVAGDLVGDGSWFEPEILHPTWETGDVPWGYAAPVSGLGLTDNSLEILVSPGASGGPARITPWPVLHDYAIENRTRTVALGEARTFDARWEGDRLVLTGGVPEGTAARREYLAVVDPARYTAGVFRQLLTEAGIAVQGATRSTTDSLLYQAARGSAPLGAVSSRPVSDWLVPILSASQNWFAEMLLKQLGRQFGASGSWDEGLRVTRRFLIDSVGVDSTQFSLRDGSGLSTVDLVTPETFVRLLTWMRRHPAYPVFAAGLPVAGETGTLRSRFVGTRLEGRVMAKTGTLTSGNTLSGYLERPKGGMLVFSIQANHHAIGGRAMVAAIDSALAIIGR